LAKAVLVVSGGMDSATMAYYYKSKGYEVHLVGFDYGQRHSKELDCLHKIGEQLKAMVTVIDLTQIKYLIGTSSLTSNDITVPDGHYAEETMRITVVPNRNAMMLSIATAIGIAEKAEIVATGIHAGDHFIYPDCRPAFFEPLSEAFTKGNEGHADENFHLEAPFINKTKADIAKLGDDLGVPYELTWSCYKGGEVHCGRCGTCVERIEAFLISETTDPTIYADGIEFALEEIEKKKNVL
jgi:7-cyano-7-deazaguanine synthase